MKNVFGITLLWRVKCLLLDSESLHWTSSSVSTLTNRYFTWVQKNQVFDHERKRDLGTKYHTFWENIRRRDNRRRRRDLSPKTSIGVRCQLLLLRDWIRSYVLPLCPTYQTQYRTDGVKGTTSGWRLLEGSRTSKPATRPVRRGR